MAAEYSANALQEVAVGGSVIFTESPVPCNRGLIFHRDESGLFRLASPSIMGVSCRRTCCCGFPEALYQCKFHCNVTVPESGTDDEEISLALFIDGEEDPSSTMLFTPTDEGIFGNVSAGIIVAVPCICRCASVSVRNTSDQPVNVQNANILFNFLGVRR